MNFGYYDLVLRERKWPKSLDEVSYKLGQSINFVQGPGGNTSWKQDGRLWIKASGYKLKEALEREIFCQVSIENPYVSLGSDARSPSIESILHSTRPEKFVVHVHTIGTVSLGCRKDWQQKGSEFLRHHKLGVIPYQRPGENLANSILKNQNDLAGCDGALLLNHGIVMWGEDIWQIYSNLLELEESLELIYPTNFELLGQIREVSLETYLEGKKLTPDHAVFADDINKAKFSDSKYWLTELRDALEISVSKIENKSNINFLTEIESLFLQNWSMEKSRKRMNS